mmetsp:Transcript_104941/g.321483  ORF Transcript_104941/g.321483 Transcript_104941/m.321483 type:complete len:378 (+) Transcript_104941:2330-3463(+)
MRWHLPFAHLARLAEILTHCDGPGLLQLVLEARLLALVEIHIEWPLVGVRVSFAEHPEVAPVHAMERFSIEVLHRDELGVWLQRAEERRRIPGEAHHLASRHELLLSHHARAIRVHAHAPGHQGVPILRRHLLVEFLQQGVRLGIQISEHDEAFGPLLRLPIVAHALANRILDRLGLQLREVAPQLLHTAVETNPLPSLDELAESQPPIAVQVQRLAPSPQQRTTPEDERLFQPVDALDAKPELDFAFSLSGGLDLVLQDQMRAPLLGAVAGKLVGGLCKRRHVLHLLQKLGAPLVRLAIVIARQPPLVRIRVELHQRDATASLRAHQVLVELPAIDLALQAQPGHAIDDVLLLELDLALHIDALHPRVQHVAVLPQ